MKTAPAPSMKLPSDPFLRGYLLAAFWTNDDSAPSGEYSDSGRPEEMMEKLSPEALAMAEKDCAEFEGANESLLSAAYEARDDYHYAEAGHDFWLTRNRHGAGFWDRDLGETGESLRLASHAAGETDLYEGDDGLLYFSR